MNVLDDKHFESARYTCLAPNAVAVVDPKHDFHGNEMNLLELNMPVEAVGISLDSPISANINTAA